MKYLVHVGIRMLFWAVELAFLLVLIGVAGVARAQSAVYLINPTTKGGRNRSL
jgi:hypothetical protein